MKKWIVVYINVVLMSYWASNLELPINTKCQKQSIISNRPLTVNGKTLNCAFQNHRM